MILTACQLASLVFFAAAPETRAYVVVIGNNQSVESGVKALRYADDDAARFYELLAPTAARIELLTVMDADTQRIHSKLPVLARAPSKENLAAVLKSFEADLASDRAAGRESVFSFVYIGHGHVGRAGQGYLSFLDGPLTSEDLWGQVVGKLNATYNHLIIDACNSYLLVGSRGGAQVDDSGPDASEAIRAYGGQHSAARYPNTGVVVSTSSAAESHEWSVFQGGIFSQEVRSALAGAADVNADGRVEYSELAAFLGAANLAIDDPRARVQASVQPPPLDHHRPLIDLAASSYKHLLRLPKSFAGKYHLEDARGVRYVDGNKTGETDVYIALANSPFYFVRTGETEARFVLPKSGTVDLRWLEFQPLARAARGSVAEAYRDLLFQIPYGPGFYQGFIARNSSVTPVQRAERPFPPAALTPRAVDQPFKNPYR
ncbi:MAG: hypothetical protein Q8L48_05135 [Archangium sp.]|nr:hypothetical protein [Archangium sp.]